MLRASPRFLGTMDTLTHTEEEKLCSVEAEIIKLFDDIDFKDALALTVFSRLDIKELRKKVLKIYEQPETIEISTLEGIQHVEVKK